jgi:hypothetical protein
LTCKKHPRVAGAFVRMRTAVLKGCTLWYTKRKVEAAGLRWAITRKWGTGMNRIMDLLAISGAYTFLNEDDLTGAAKPLHHKGGSQGDATTTSVRTVRDTGSA